MPMTRIGRSLPALAVLLIAPLAVCSQGGPTIPQAEFQATMRKLWEDHITWTRMYIVSAAANLPDKDAVASRLLRNQDDIGNAIKPFYGDAAGTQLTGLLRGHITIATEIIDAAMQGDTARKDDAAGRWGLNADSIATFLNTANAANWELAEMQGMLREHLQITTDEVVAHLGQDWNGSIAAYDLVHDQALRMADGLSNGIMAQFPERFGK